MHCSRCTGLMIRDDLQDETGLDRFVAWRCLICGEVLDPVILENRSEAPNLMVDRGRHWPKVQCVSTVEHRARRFDPYREFGDDPSGFAPSAGVPELSNLADRSLVELGDVSV